MNQKVRFGFLLETLAIPIRDIVPTKTISDERKLTEPYKRIVVSVKAEGLVEPPVVARDRKSSKYFLLDGHVRVEALRELGVKEVTCLIATDDESYTFGEHVNPIAPIQSHRMIKKAIAKGVPEARIAQALNVSIDTVQRNRTMLDGICSEAVELLKNKPVARVALEIMKKVKPVRQIAMAELMEASKIYSASYAKALYVATAEAELVTPKKPPTDALSASELAKMQQENQALERDYVLLSDSYGENIMELSLACQYLKKLFGSGKVVRYLSAHHADVYNALVKVVESTSLDS